VIVSSPTERDRRLAGLTEAVGTRVDSVQSDSPAAGGKLRENDLILAIDGHRIADSDAFVQIVGGAPVDRPVAIDIVRDGKSNTITLTLRKRQLPVAAVTHDNQRLRWGGMVLGAMPHVTGADGVSAGLMVYGIDPASPFTKLGIHEGSVITTVAGKLVNSVVEMQGIINDKPIAPSDLGLANDVVTAVTASASDTAK
jgi:serine protease DegQ